MVEVINSRAPDHSAGGIEARRGPPPILQWLGLIGPWAVLEMEGSTGASDPVTLSSGPPVAPLRMNSLQ